MADVYNLDLEATELPSDKAVINLANSLLTDFNIDTHIDSIEDISSPLFVVLFERLFSEKLPGIIRQTHSREDEIHNCQIVIDVLSTDVVHDSLSHISGVGVVSGDVSVIYNLLDIFSYLLEYVSNRIDSDVPTDIDDTKTSLVLSDIDGGDMPDRWAVRERAASKTNGAKIGHSPASKGNGLVMNGQRKTVPKSSANGRKTPDLNTNENRHVISHKEWEINSTVRSTSQRAPSPIRPDESTSLLGLKSFNSDLSLDAFDKKHRLATSAGESPVSKSTWREEDKKTHSDSYGASASADAQKATADLEEPLSDKKEGAKKSEPELNKQRTAPSSFSASLPAHLQEPEYDRHEPLRSTVGPIHYTSHLDQERHAYKTTAGYSTSLDDLRHLVEKTAAMTRVALEKSPVRTRTIENLEEEDPYIDRPRPRISSKGVRLAKQLNSKSLDPGKGCSSKKVAFAPSSLYDHSLSTRHRRDGSASSDPEGFFDETELRRRINNQDMAYGDPIKSRSKPSKKANSSLARHFAHNRQPELGAAAMTLRTQDRALARKQNILKAMYDEDLDDFSEEVRHMLDLEAKRTGDTEEKFLKECKSGIKKKKVTTKGKGSQLPYSSKKARIIQGKKPPSRTEAKSGSADAPILLECEEDLLPLMLEEFPHLHLSQHTWHELWRKGLTQIQSLTHAYQGAERKKSREQDQLEEAAHRHELMTTLMKKQLDHTKRQRDVKDQRVLHAHLRNKAHDKRAQSARARKYYNEYQVRARGKQLKRRTKEEMVFKDVFKEAMTIQKERIKDIRQYATVTRKRQESRRQNEIDSMENFYRDQFDMLTDRLTRERADTQVRDSAQQKVMSQMKRELRQKMEAEIKTYQDALLKDEDDAHWRKMDSDRVKQQLHMARYSAKI